jgi:phytoene dehydrogenase-like protein
MPKDPQMFVPLPDGRHFFVWRDGARTREELERVRGGEGDAYARWSSFWGEAVRLLRPLVDDPDPPAMREVERILPDDVWRLAVAGSAASTVEEFFEVPEVQGAFASQGIIGTWAGVRDEGTAWVAAYHAIGGEVCGADGTWAYVRGGMGSVTRALAAAAREAGADIRVGTGVTEIMRGGGVRLASGQVIRARAVLSNAHPITTFALAGLDAPAAWRTPGCVLKVNLALRELPDFAALPGAGPQHNGTVEVAPSIDYLQRAYEDAAKGQPSRHPYMEVFVQSAVDGSLVDGDGHVLSAFTQYVPPEVEDWPSIRGQATQNVIDALSFYAPNIRESIVTCSALGPPELEERFGLLGGNIFHGEITPDQCFGNRFDYRTPVPGLYLCGSGARPGGGVMGAAGRNCARLVISELGR